MKSFLFLLMISIVNFIEAQENWQIKDDNVFGLKWGDSPKLFTKVLGEPVGVFTRKDGGHIYLFSKELALTFDNKDKLASIELNYYMIRSEVSCKKNELIQNAKIEIQNIFKLNMNLKDLEAKIGKLDINELNYTFYKKIGLLNIQGKFSVVNEMGNVYYTIASIIVERGSN